MSTSKVTPRNIRLSDQIQRELALLLTQTIKDPRVKWIQITNVSLTPDYAHANVLISPFYPEKETEIIKGLNACKSLLRRELAKRVVMHTSPELHFKIDHSQTIRTEMDKLIEQAIQKTQSSEEKKQSTH
jgi:ribosome-binding factor A